MSKKVKTEVFQSLSEQLSLVPVKGKIPYEDAWQWACRKKRDYDPSVFQEYNAGIACGPASGVLAIDPDHIPKFEKYCQDNNWNLPRTRKHKTGSGNYHLLYKYPQDGRDYGNKSIKDPEGEINPKNGKVWTIFDVRGVGGQIVAPGSIHPETGEYYEIEDDYPIVDAPECLLKLYDEQNAKEYEQTEACQYTAWDGNIDCLEINQEDIDLIKNGTAPGARSDKMFRCLKVLIKSGLADNQIIQVLRKHPNGIAVKWLKDKRGKIKWIQDEIKRARQKNVQPQPKTKAATSDKTNHIDIARKVIAAIGPDNILEAQSSIWMWRGGVWRKVDIREIKKKIHAIAAGFPVQLNRSLVESVCDLTRTEIYRPDHKFDVNYKIINCLNGELHWSGDKWDMKPHAKENYQTTQIPVAYDENAIAPRFERFLEEIFRDNPDKYEKKQIVLEAIGYSLLSTCEYEKFFILIGPGANGKSVLMDTIAALVGPDQVAAVQPSQFENKFQRAHLQGKLVNLVSEIAEGHEIADAQLKAIVSGELTTAEHKLQKPFEFSPFATCIFGTNHMPHTRDFSEALFRRAIILTFNRKFEEHEQDKHLREKLGSSG